MAAAEAVCCKWVRARPIYLAERKPVRRTLCEIVLSMPARQAMNTQWTRLAVFPVKEERNIRCATNGLAGITVKTGLAVGAGRFLVVPVDAKVRVVKGSLDAVLPVLSGRKTTHQIHSLLSAFHQEIHLHIAFIHQVDLGQPSMSR